MGTLEVRAFDAPLGAEVVGADPGVSLAEGTLHEIRRALAQYRLLLFRGEPRPNSALAAFARRFGELVSIFDDDATEPGHPEILQVSSQEIGGEQIGAIGAEALPWHSDHSYLARPAKESLLEAVEVSEDGPPTCFVDLYRAWDELPEHLRRRVEGTRAVHGLGTGLEEIYAGDVNRGAQASIAPHRSAHPIAARHPETGRVGLYVNPLNVRSIEGLSEGEGVALLQELVAHATRPEGVYRHHWRKGDFVVFDNIGSMHSRPAFEVTHQRFLKQISVECPGPLEM
jgi:taurine dioxygenase